MTEQAFLEKHIYKGLSNLNEGQTENPIFRFSEKDFALFLERAAYYGLRVYTIETFLDDQVHGAANHEDFRKKATDAAWYEKAFATFRLTQVGLTYSATCKVSVKLLERYS